MKIYTLTQLQAMVDLEKNLDKYLSSQERAYTNYSQNKVKVLQPIQIDFIKEQGDCHIKSAFRKGASHFIIKCATGFYGNTKSGLPSGDGAYLILCQKTGRIEAMLHDQGWLTTLRTALGCLVVMKLTPWNIQRVGIVGCGKVAKMIVHLLSQLMPQMSISMWSRSSENSKALKSSYSQLNLVPSITDITQDCDVVVTTTPSTDALIESYGSYPQHIIALGADSEYKQELGIRLLAKADHVLADSISQVIKYGDSAHAIRHGLLKKDNITELGDIITGNRQLAQGTIITDLTGIASQDLELVNTLPL